MKRSIKGIALILGVLLAAQMLASCAQEPDYPPALTPNLATPPAQTGTQATFEAALYFVSEDGRKLYPEERKLAYGAGISRAETALRALLEGPESALLRRSLPEGLNLEHVELSLGVCNVYFTGAFPEQVRAWLTARAAIAATVFAAEGIGAVNVFFNGVEPGYEGRPLGTLSPVSDALDVYLKNMEQDYEVIPNEPPGEAVAYETHAATLYFTDVSRSLIAAKTTDLTYAVNAAAEDIVQLIFERLRAGDSGANSLEPVLPADIRIKEAVFLDIGPEAEPTPDPQAPPQPQDGEEAHILELVLAYGAEHSGFDEELMCAALTMTLTSYLPGLDGVRIGIEGPGGVIRALGEDYFERIAFRGRIGHGVRLYYPDEEGEMLLPVTRIVSSASAYDPALRLAELLRGPADPGVAYTGFLPEDVRGVYIAGTTAVVDWNEGFSEKLRRLIAEADTPVPVERREMMFLFGVISTLTDLPFIRRVWMLEGGEKLGNIQDIYLGNPLVRSPGLVAEG